MSEISQSLRARGEHDAAYAIEILEERCAYFVEELEVAKEHFHTIRDWLGENKLDAVDNLAGDAAASIARRLPAIQKHGSSSPPPQEEPR